MTAPEPVPLAHLRRDAALARLIDALPADAGVPAGPWRRRAEQLGPFGALLRTVVGQQISSRAAQAIFDRLLGLLGEGPPAPERLLGLSDAQMRSAGLSAAKVASMRDLAERIRDGRLELDRLGELSDEAVLAQLVTVRGIGRWSAEMFLLGTLGRPDVLPSGDVVVRKAVQRLYGLAAQPTPAEVDLLGERWRPYRSWATRLLYASKR